MSIARILVGTLAGAGLLAGLLVAAVRFPSIALLAMFGAAGSFLCFVAYHGLRTGTIGAGKRSRYERGAQPWGFWFYVLFYALLGAAVFGYGVYGVLHSGVASR
jgi:hypothetical protein